MSTEGRTFVDRATKELESYQDDGQGFVIYQLGTRSVCPTMVTFDQLVEAVPAIAAAGTFIAAFTAYRAARVAVRGAGGSVGGFLNRVSSVRVRPGVPTLHPTTKGLKEHP